MARLPRVNVQDVPHHVTQRGNRRQTVFFCEDDYREYLRLLREQGQHYGLKVWAYCLMSNHVHLIVVPTRPESLTRAMAETHRRYTRYINFREGWRGYLWQGRFSSFPLDEAYLYAAVRYVERNPVEAKLVRRAEAYLWSSARSHVHGFSDPVLSRSFLTEEIRDWAVFLQEGGDGRFGQVASQHGSTGRPLGSDRFLAGLEQQTGRYLRRRRPGPKLKVKR
jgi:putative transposase